MELADLSPIGTLALIVGVGALLSGALVRVRRLRPAAALVPPFAALTFALVAAATSARLFVDTLPTLCGGLRMFPEHLLSILYDTLRWALLLTTAGFASATLGLMWARSRCAVAGGMGVLLCVILSARSWALAQGWRLASDAWPAPDDPRTAELLALADQLTLIGGAALLAMTAAVWGGLSFRLARLSAVCLLTPIGLVGAWALAEIDTLKRLTYAGRLATLHLEDVPAVWSGEDRSRVRARLFIRSIYGPTYGGGDAVDPRTWRFSLSTAWPADPWLEGRWLTLSGDAPALDLVEEDWFDSAGVLELVVRTGDSSTSVGAVRLVWVPTDQIAQTPEEGPPSIWQTIRPVHPEATPTVRPGQEHWDWSAALSGVPGIGRPALVGGRLQGSRLRATGGGPTVGTVLIPGDDWTVQSVVELCLAADTRVSSAMRGLWDRPTCVVTAADPRPLGASTAP